MIRHCDSKGKVHKHTKILNNDGQPAQSQYEEAFLFQKHFGEVMHAKTAPFNDIVVKDLEHAMDEPHIYCSVSDADLIAALPSPTQVVFGFLRRKTGKGHGEDNIKNEFIRKYAQMFMILQYLLYVKSYMRLAPPLQWKGGLVAALFKGKGSPSLTSNHRDIMLGSDSGKSFVGHVRSCILRMVKYMSVDTQFGSGMNGGESAMAHLYVRCVIDAAKFLKCGMSILYMDVATAFATMLRRLVFDTEQGDEAWPAKLQANGFTDNDISQIYDHLRCFKFGINEEGVYYDGEDKGIALAFSMAQQLYTDTWVSTEGVPHVLATTEGSGAGMPLADIVYGIAVSRV